MKEYQVYLLQSKNDENQKYIGISENLENRIKEHNLGNSKHTSKYKPWKLVAYFTFFDKCKAYEFEKYLKTHSGRAFASKRFW